jgi:hypothetical protein
MDQIDLTGPFEVLGEAPPLGTFSGVAGIEGLLAIRPSIVNLHCLLGSAAAAWRQ